MEQFFKHVPNQQPDHIYKKSISVYPKVAGHRPEFPWHRVTSTEWYWMIFLWLKLKPPLLPIKTPFLEIETQIVKSKSHPNSDALPITNVSVASTWPWKFHATFPPSIEVSHFPWRFPDFPAIPLNPVVSGRLSARHQRATAHSYTGLGLELAPYLAGQRQHGEPSRKSILEPFKHGERCWF